MKPLLVIGCMLAVMLCSIAYAQDITEFDEMEGPSSTSLSVTCNKENLTRIVELSYTATKGQPPCEVHYKKITEQPGNDQVLWNAQNTAGYCETKQREFVATLRDMGWNCQ